MPAAAGIPALTRGVRQSLRPFVLPIHGSRGYALARIRFALAIGPLIWGVAPPLFGAAADPRRSGAVVQLGGVMPAAGLMRAALRPTQ